MAKDDANPAIPAWQRTQKHTNSSETTREDTQNEEQESPSTAETTQPKEVEIPSPAEPEAAVAAEELGSHDTSPTLQLQHMQTFLEDPAVKSAPIQKKRAFFLSKGISKEQTDKALKDESQPTLDTDDFKNFQQEQPLTTPSKPPPSPQPTSAIQQQRQTTAPPIITYPEFLVDAHKPPPLITPASILNTAYVASGIAAILYGASKFLVTPMSDSLTAARHEFAEHSLSKVDEINERLTTLVSKVPASATKTDKPLNPPDDAATDDSASSASDPTELFHRDTGTQTSPPNSRRPSLSSSSTLAAASKPDPTTRSSTALSLLTSHISDLIQQTENLETSNKDKNASLEKLKDYLDTLMYAGAGGGMWSGDSLGGYTREKADGTAVGDDALEALKKEIRGVKGVLLSAKRFPGVVGRVGA